MKLLLKNRRGEEIFGENINLELRGFISKRNRPGFCRQA